MRRTVRYSPAPDESRPSVNAHTVTPRTRDLSEPDFSTALEQIKRQHRGVKLAIAEAELTKDRIVLQQKHVEIGIARVNLQSTQQDFLTAAHRLVEKRARTAIAHDNAQAAVAEWGMGQDAIRHKIQGLHLSVQEAQHKNQEKRDDLQLKGMPARLLQ
jgi:hypothetical protein